MAGGGSCDPPQVGRPLCWRLAKEPAQRLRAPQPPGAVPPLRRPGTIQHPVRVREDLDRSAAARRDRPGSPPLLHPTGAGRRDACGGSERVPADAPLATRAPVPELYLREHPGSPDRGRGDEAAAPVLAGWLIRGPALASSIERATGSRPLGSPARAARRPPAHHDAAALAGGCARSSAGPRVPLRRSRPPSAATTRTRRSSPARVVPLWCPNSPAAPGCADREVHPLVLPASGGLSPSCSSA